MSPGISSILGYLVCIIVIPFNNGQWSDSQPPNMGEVKNLAPAPLGATGVIYTFYEALDRLVKPSHFPTT